MQVALHIPVWQQIHYQPFIISVNPGGQAKSKLKQRADWGRASKELTYPTLMLPLASVYFKGLWHLVFVGKSLLYTQNAGRSQRRWLLDISLSCIILNTKILMSFIILWNFIRSLAQCEPIWQVNWNQHGLLDQFLKICFTFIKIGNKNLKSVSPEYPDGYRQPLRTV